MILGFAWDLASRTPRPLDSKDGGRGLGLGALGLAVRRLAEDEGACSQ